MNSRQALQNALVRARKSAKLTQTQLAVRLDRPQSFVSKYESGRRRLDVVELIDIAGSLGVDVAALIRGLSRVRRTLARMPGRSRAPAPGRTRTPEQA